MVLSLYGDTPAEFSEDFKSKILFVGVTENDVEVLSEPTGINLAKLAASYSDGIILGSADVDPELVEYSKISGLPVLPFNAEAIQSGSYIEDYNSFYDNL